MSDVVTVDPAAQGVLDRIAGQMAAAPRPLRPPSETERVAAVRRAYAGAAQLAGPPESVADVDDRPIPSAAGAIPVRIYRPRREGGATPVLIWLHGGSFISGDLDTHDAPLRALANRAAMPVIAVQWRLAPEHPYPAGLEDAFAVLAWAESGDDPDIDPRRIAVGGDSAGGALAAALALLARDRGGATLAAQVLVYPNTDLTGDGGYASWTQNDGRVLRRDEMERNIALYVDGADRTAPTISPLHADDLAGLPPALIVTGEADPLRDEGEAYGERMRTSGVAVAVTRYPGMIHGFFQMGGVIPAGREVIDRIAAWLTETLAPPSTTRAAEKET